MNKQITAENRVQVFGHTSSADEIAAALRVAEDLDLTISFRAYSPSEQRSDTGDLRARIYWSTLNWGYSPVSSTR